MSWTHTDEPRYSQLFPDLAANSATGQNVSELDEWIDSLIDQARTEELGEAAFGGVTDVETLNLFHRGFDAARSLFAPHNIDVPEPEEFLPEIDWQAYAARALPTHELVVAPHGLGVSRWQAISDKIIELSVSTDIRAEFDRVDRVDEARERQEARAVSVSPFGRNLTWTARLIPLNAAPAETGQKWNAHDQMTLPEMLVTQLSRSLQHRELIDPQTFTWLAGAFAHGRKAARHTFDRSTRTLRISSREIGQQGAHQGSRPPVSMATIEPGFHRSSLKARAR